MPITSQYSADLFRLIRMSTLSRQHFEMHPIWSELYDFDEREEIVSWGVDPVWLKESIDRLDTGNDHLAYPILRPYPLPQRMRLYIKAQMTTASGDKIDGYVMDDDAGVIHILRPKSNVTFGNNPLLAELNQTSLSQLKSELSLSEPIFPIHYETDFLNHEDQLIRGEFIAGL